MLFQWPFQCFEVLLRETLVIIESPFGRSCNPQFQAFNLKSSLLLKSSAFSLALFTSLLKSTFLGCGDNIGKDRWRGSLLSAGATDGRGGWPVRGSLGKCGQLGFSGFGWS
jgi:hypothetical protein